MIRFALRSCFLLVALMTLASCSCGRAKKGIRIGIDADWMPLNFYGQEVYVNGFVEELLQEISGYSGLRFERVNANCDTLLGGLGEQKYDAVLSALPPYNFNTAKYEFSKNFLDVGPVLVVAAASEKKGLEEMSNELVGVLAGDQAVLILQKYPDVIMRNYGTVSEALEALAGGEVEGLLLDRLLAASYVRDLYAGVLKIAGKPLNDLGLHMILPKGKNPSVLVLFNRSLDHLAKKKKLQDLMKKWELD